MAGPAPERPPLGPTPTMEWVRAAARVALHGGGPELASLDPGLLDPAEVTALVLRHRVEGLVFRGLDHLPPSPAVEGLRRALREVVLPGVATNLSRITELQRVTEIMGAAGIPVLTFKGPTLAVLAYGDPTLRPYGDLDVLLPPERSEEVVAALLDAGYRDQRAGLGLDASPDQWHQWGFIAPDGRTLVEVHWSLVRPARFPRVDSTEAWGTPVRVPLPGGTVRTLAPEVLLPLLCLHATSHGWGWLEFPASIAGLLLRTGAMDWDEVLARAERWRVRRILAVGVGVAELLFGVGAIREGVELRGRTSGLVQEIGGRLLRESAPPRTATAAHLWTQVRIRDSWGEGARAGARLLLDPTPTEWTAAGGFRAGRGARGTLLRLRRLFRGGWGGMG